MNSQDYMEGVSLHALADAVGTPAYVYSSAHFTAQYQALTAALSTLDHRICYAVKANSNLAVLRHFQELGAGFDIVSAGELQRVLTAGGDPATVVFSGVGKTVVEIDAALQAGIACFNVESRAELNRISARAAALDQRAAISIRVNPDVDAATHPYISTGLRENKFGVPTEEALALYRQAHRDPHLKVAGIDCHIGSQITTTAPLLDAVDALLALVAQLEAEGIHVEHLDIGGGMGVVYNDESPFDVAAYGRALTERLHNRSLTLMLEPGRFLVANGGLLLTRVEYLKPATTDDGHSFAIVDAAMNDLIRPALYSAHHNIRRIPHTTGAPGETRSWDIVGPVCESGDFLGKARRLTLREGDLLAIYSAGAYGMVQASNYNSRGRAAEVLVTGDTFRVVRRRETIEDQLRPEQDLLP